MKYLIIINILFIIIPLFSQNNSFLNRFGGNNADHKDYCIAESNARDLLFTLPDSSLYFAQKAYDIAVNKDIFWGKIIAKSIMGYAYYFKGRYADGVSIFLSNLKDIESAKESKMKNFCLGEIYDGLGCNYCEAGIYEQGIPYLIRSKDLVYKIRDSVGILNENSTIGIYYEKMNKLDSAEYYLTKSLTFENEIKNYAYHKGILNSLGNCYFKKSFKEKAYQSWADALKINFEDNVTESEIYRNLGNYFFERELYDSTYFYLKNSIKKAENVKNIQALYKSNDALLKLFEKINNRDSINFYLNICYNLKDSAIQNENLKQLQNFHIYEQLRQQELEKTRLAFKSKTSYSIFSAIIVFFIIFSLIQYYNIRNKQKAKKQIEKAYHDLEHTHKELKSTQSQLIQSEKMASLGELTAGIAHEIQNPLNFVNNFSELNGELIKELEEEASSEKRDTKNEAELITAIKDNSMKINQHGQRASSIVKGMLEHSRKSTGVKELTDINKLCDEFVRLSYHGLRAKDPKFNCDYKLDLDPSLPLVNVVSQDIGRVILNVINNAFQACSERLALSQAEVSQSASAEQSRSASAEQSRSASAEQSRSASAEQSRSAGSLNLGNQEDYKPLVVLTTKFSASQRLCEMCISDNGPGIPPHIKDKIFQPFFTTKPTGQGTGLGLSLAYDIVKAHSGEIKVVSNENVGTEFIIQISIL